LRRCGEQPRSPGRIDQQVVEQLVAADQQMGHPGASRGRCSPHSPMGASSSRPGSPAEPEDRYLAIVQLHGDTTDASAQIKAMNQRPRPGCASPPSGNRPKGAPCGAPILIGTGLASAVSAFELLVIVNALAATLWMGGLNQESQRGRAREDYEPT